MSFDGERYKKLIDDLVSQYNHHLAEVDRLREEIHNAARLRSGGFVTIKAGDRVRYIGSDEEWLGRVLFVNEVWIDESDCFNALYPLYSHVEISWPENPLELIYTLVPPNKSGSHPKYPRIFIQAKEDEFELLS